MRLCQQDVSPISGMRMEVASNFKQYFLTASALSTNTKATNLMCCCHAWQPFTLSGGD
jgi:hypothetical protein